MQSSEQAESELGEIRFNFLRSSPHAHACRASWKELFRWCTRRGWRITSHDIHTLSCQPDMKKFNIRTFAWCRLFFCLLYLGTWFLFYNIFVFYLTSNSLLELPWIIYFKLSCVLSKFAISHPIASFLIMTEYIPVWQDGCKGLFMNETIWSPANNGLNRTVGLVDQYGNPMAAFDNTTTWGITRETCYKYCGTPKLRQVGYVKI